MFLLWCLIFKGPIIHHQLRGGGDDGQRPSAHVCLSFCVAISPTNGARNMFYLSRARGWSWLLICTGHSRGCFGSHVHLYHCRVRVDSRSRAVLIADHGTISLFFAEHFWTRGVRYNAIHGSGWVLLLLLLLLVVSESDTTFWGHASMDMGRNGVDFRGQMSRKCSVFCTS